jgi:hypothetical protein
MVLIGKGSSRTTIFPLKAFQLKQVVCGSYEPFKFAIFITWAIFEIFFQNYSKKIHFD